MNIKLILASVALLGSATTAIASAECLPAPAPVALQAPAPVLQSNIYRPWTVVLSSGDKIGRSGREQIELGRTRPLQKIELQATSGRTDVREVAIKFANGQSELVKENAVLERGGSLCIDLAGYHGRDVTAIRVFGASSTRGSFKVLGTVSTKTT